MKRTFDLIVSVTLLLPGVVICAVLAAIYLLVERTNPFFKQIRIGKDEKEFTLYKIRTMHKSAKSLGTHEIDASVVTGIGRIIRKTKLDELPQLLNVIFGDMSLVGPRPSLASQVDVRTERRSRGVFKIKPGITGFAQVQGIDMSRPELLAEADAEYMNEISIWNDIKILIMTMTGSGFGDQIRQR